MLAPPALCITSRSGSILPTAQSPQGFRSLALSRPRRPPGSASGWHHPSAVALCGCHLPHRRKYYGPLVEVQPLTPPKSPSGRLPCLPVITWLCSLLSDRVIRPTVVTFDEPNPRLGRYLSGCMTR